MVRNDSLEIALQERIKELNCLYEMARLAERGTTFHECHVQSPVCVPSRTSAAIGRFSASAISRMLQPIRHAVSRSNVEKRNVACWFLSSARSCSGFSPSRSRLSRIERNVSVSDFMIRVTSFSGSWNCVAHRVHPIGQHIVFTI